MVGLQDFLTDVANAELENLDLVSPPEHHLHASGQEVINAALRLLKSDVLTNC